MNEDEYKEKVSKINQLMDQIQEDYQKDRINLERKFDEQLEKGNRLLEKHNEEYTEFKYLQSGLSDIAERLYSNPNATPDTYTYNLGQISDGLQELDRQYLDRENKITEAISELHHDYDDIDEEFQSEYNSNLNTYESQLDDLKDEYYSESD